MSDIVNKEGWSRDTEASYNAGKKGTDCTVLAEGIPKYIKAPCEDVISGKNNTYIVLGRDRPGAEDTGYGGKGATHAGAISLVAGRLSHGATDLDPRGNEKYAEPNHRTDAAFIYISQKTDIDDNFKLAYGFVGAPEAKSGIGIKADNVRVISRQGIKLVTGVDDKLSTGAASIETYGIDLIAGNNDIDMQPIVKGDNLIECLVRFKKELSKLNGILSGFLQYQLEFNVASLFHFHTTTVPLMKTTPTLLEAASPQMAIGPKVVQRMAKRSLRSLANQKYNLNQLQLQFLTPGDAEDGFTSYINSKYNNVN
tara:strand:- start:3107 stop:4039 length:933 start_codon:yes stop_codon:yes gene_type:complete